MSLTLTLIRGLPGSGKSTLAKTMGVAHYEADMYFIDADGNYVYDAAKISQAHDWCRQQTEQSLRSGNSVVVANTFVRLWEMKAYRALAKRYRAELKVVECTGQYSNIHGVAEETINKMRKRWQTWPSAQQS
ncbi:ATP-binding protein [Vibrio sp. SCSIO 43135]|uniref:ATP-binding protein n=1 Tax=Vibrio sp. SCSIO 43135 TaxID=2819096 RepID=UPI002075ECC6|nr:ATP-binding protein [Vibrio sp. SCSIO 43135]USD42423.1 ATP-binding protein [Vibrio sp. SCSIO 43135]